MLVHNREKFYSRKWIIHNKIGTDGCYDSKCHVYLVSTEQRSTYVILVRYAIQSNVHALGYYAVQLDYFGIVRNFRDHIKMLMVYFQISRTIMWNSRWSYLFFSRISIPARFGRCALVTNAWISVSYPLSSYYWWLCLHLKISETSLRELWGWLKILVLFLTLRIFNKEMNRRKES